MRRRGGGGLKNQMEGGGTSMLLENVNFIYIKNCHHILNVGPDFPCKRIDLCHKISIILVFITRPNSTKNIFVANKPFALRYCPLLRQL